MGEWCWPIRQPLLPADEEARSLYLLDIGTGHVRCINLPDVVADVAADLHAAAGRAAGAGVARESASSRQAARSKSSSEHPHEGYADAAGKERRSYGFKSKKYVRV